jgi:hypothetical protein
LHLLLSTAIAVAAAAAAAVVHVLNCGDNLELLSRAHALLFLFSFLSCDTTSALPSAFGASFSSLVDCTERKIGKYNRDSFYM